MCINNILCSNHTHKVAVNLDCRALLALLHCSLARGLAQHRHRILALKRVRASIMPSDCMQEGKTLFAVTAAGAVRSYRLPLNGDYSEVRTHGGPISGVGLMYDDSLLFTVSDDCSLFVFDVQQDMKVGSRRVVERIPFADEVMVTKIDLEEKRSRCEDLQACPYAEHFTSISSLCIRS